MSTPTINKGQIAIDPTNGILYFKNHSNVLVNTSLNWSQPSNTLIETSDSVQINSDITISGNLVVSGNTTTLNTEVLTVEDNIIILNSGVTGAPSLNAGVEVERGTSTNVQLRWNESTDKWQFTNNGTDYLNINENVSSANTWSTPRTLTLSGDLSGSVSIDGSQNVTLNGTIVSNSVALGSDTTGDYVQSLVAGTGVTVSNNSGEGTTPTISIGQDVSSSANVSFNTVTANFVGNITGNVSSISTHNIDELADVVIASPQNGQILQYNGSAWVNNVMPSSEPIGHENKSQSTISFNESTRQFSISPVSGSYNVWCKGIKYIKTSTETVTVDNTPGLHYIYFSNTGVLSSKMSFFDWENDTPTAYIYWNQTDSKAYFFADERHGVTLDWATHEYLHRTRGAVMAEGFGVNGYTLVGDGNTDSHAVLSLANGTFFDEDLQIDVIHSVTPTANTWEQRLQSNAYIPIFYHSNTHWKKDTATQFPMKQGSARVQYNLNTAGNWSTVDITSNKWGITWLVATNNLNEPVLGILGQEIYLTLGDAEAAVWEDLNLDGFPVFEFRPLHKVIYQTATGYTNTPHAALRGVYDLRRVTSSGGGIPTTPVSDHGSMTGLSDDDHTQYLTADRHDAHDHTAALSTASINDLADVTLNSSANGDFLRFNGSVWINDAVNLSTDTIGDYLANIVAGDAIDISNSGGEASSPTISVAPNSIDGNHISLAFQYTESIEAGNNIIINNDYVGLGSVGIYTVETSATPNFTSVTTTSLIVDNIEIDPTGANNSDQVLRFNGTKFIPGVASTVASLSDLTDVSNTAPSAGNFLGWSGTEWAPLTPGTGMPIVSDSAPVSPSAGQLWFQSNTARTFIRYVDSDSSQWIEIGAAAAPETTVTKISQVIGNGSSSTAVVNHNLNTRNVIVEIYDNNTFETVTAGIARTTLDSITASFAAPIPVNRYTVVVIG